MSWLFLRGFCFCSSFFLIGFVLDTLRCLFLDKRLFAVLGLYAAMN